MLLRPSARERAVVIAAGSMYAAIYGYRSRVRIQQESSRLTHSGRVCLRRPCDPELRWASAGPDDCHLEPISPVIRARRLRAVPQFDVMAQSRLRSPKMLRRVAPLSALQKECEHDRRFVGGSSRSDISALRSPASVGDGVHDQRLGAASRRFSQFADSSFRAYASVWSMNGAIRQRY